MNVRELVFRGEDATKLYACGACGQCYSPKVYACADAVAHETARKAAEKCCVPPTCSVCGVEVSRPWTMCAKHREQAKLARAKPVPASEWKDIVYHPDLLFGMGEPGYSWSVDDFKDNWAEGFCHYEEPQRALPAYCWPCEAQTLRLDPDSLLENAVDDMHEDASSEIVGADDLICFIEAWNAKQTCKSWYPDYSRVIVLDEARFKALLEG